MSALTTHLVVQGECPEGCGRTLFVSAGGFITCSWAECPNPSAASDLLRNPTLLRVTEEALVERNERLGRIERLARGESA